MNWYIVDKKYVKYLQEYDPKVGNVEYGDKLKLHIGTLLEVDEMKYYVPISSPKRKHDKMGNGVDFHKLIEYDTGKLLAVININNMIPVPDECLIQLKYDNIQDYRKFSGKQDRINYIYLLQKEKDIIDQIDEVLSEKAKKLLEKVKLNPHSSLARRCCNFGLLQEKAKQYKKDC